MENYKNKIVVISGGLGDIGSAIALAFGRKGAKVAISDLVDFEDAKHRLDKLRSKGCAELSYHKVDVVSESEINLWIDSVEQKWGLPQIIIPNAGIVIAGSLTGDDLTTEDVRKQQDVNFWGSYHLAVQASKRIRAKGIPGRITFIGSWAAERPNARISAYCISKASIRMLCKTLALELAENDILVNEVAPGIVEGGLSKKNQQRDPKLLELHLKSTPTRRLVSVDEIATHVLRLSDFEYNNLTGITLTVDGGLSLTSKMTP